MQRKELLAIGILVTLVFCFLITPAYSGENVIKLRMAFQDPENCWEAKHSVKPWVEKVEKATKGRVAIEVYYANTLSKGPSNWEAAKTGLADIAWAFHGYWPGMTPLADVVTLPFLPFRNGEHASASLWQLYEKYPSLANQFNQNKVLFLYTTSPYFVINSKREIKTMNDLKGLKIRVPGGPPTESLKLLGATPVSMPFSDTYVNLEKKVIDGMGTCFNGMIAFKLWEVVKFYTYAPLYVSYFSLAMNWNTWNRLPADVQKQIESVSGLVAAKSWGKSYDLADKEGPGMVKSSNHEMVEYTVGQKEVAKWKETAQPLYRKWLDDNKAFPDAQKILDTALKLAEGTK